MNLNQLDKEQEKLVKLYQKTYLHLLKVLEQQIDKGLSQQQARAILNQLQKEFKQLDEVAYKWSYEILPQYYYLGLDDVDAQVAYLNNIEVIASGSVAVLHQEAIKVASQSLYYDLAKNTQFMSDQAKKIIRDNAKELLDMAIITGDSYKKTKKELKQALKDNGVTSFIDAGKKEWKIDNYVSMAVRTKSRLLHNEGTINRLTEYRDKYPSNPNFDLIQISSHGSKCWCGYYEGTVWSLTGNSKDYPSVERLPNYPYRSFHPNCKHVWKPYIESLRGKGKIVSSSLLDRDIKSLNKEHYHKNK